MQDNPFSKIVSIMRDNAHEVSPTSFRIGKVISEYPISIDIGGAVQKTDSLVFTTEYPSFRTGEKVLMIPIEEEQRYIVITRVVGL